jgi:hypothetical protein
MEEERLRCGCPSPYHDFGLCQEGAALRATLKRKLQDLGEAHPDYSEAEIAYYAHFLRNGWETQGFYQDRAWRLAIERVKREREDQAEGLLRDAGLIGCTTKSGRHGEMKHNGRCEFCGTDLHICTEKCDHPPRPDAAPWEQSST